MAMAMPKLGALRVSVGVGWGTTTTGAHAWWECVRASAVAFLLDHQTDAACACSTPGQRQAKLWGIYGQSGRWMGAGTAPCTHVVVVSLNLHPQFALSP
jgi:hypothetical protein